MSDISHHKRCDPAEVHVFFDHRLTRSTVAITAPDCLASFELPRSEAVVLQARLDARSGSEKAVLVDFIEQWRRS